jgi:hypothetical protein
MVRIRTLLTAAIVAAAGTAAAMPAVASADDIPVSRITTGGGAVAMPVPPNATADFVVSCTNGRRIFNTAWQSDAPEGLTVDVIAANSGAHQRHLRITNTTDQQLTYWRNYSCQF